MFSQDSLPSPGQVSSPTAVIDVGSINSSDGNSDYARLPYQSNLKRKRISFASLVALNEYHWANFLGGFFTFILSIAILPSLGRRYPGMKEGGYVGTSLLCLGIVWTILSILNVWESDLSLNYPIAVDEQRFQAQLLTSLKESGYVIYTNGVGILLSYKFIYFLQFRPVTRFFSKNEFGTKFHYRFGLILPLLPTTVVAIGVFIFLYSLSYSEIPKNEASCEVRRWVLVAPSVCLLPGILLYFWGPYERMRWGAMTAVGVQFLLMGLLLWVLSFYYCFSNVYLHMLAWGLECIGMGLILYAALRPNALADYVFDSDFERNLDDRSLRTFLELPSAEDIAGSEAAPQRFASSNIPRFSPRGILKTGGHRQQNYDATTPVGVEESLLAGTDDDQQVIHEEEEVLEPTDDDDDDEDVQNLGHTSTSSTNSDAEIKN